MKKIICLFAVLSGILIVKAQNADSLINILSTTNLSSDKQLELYNKIYNTYIYYDLKNASIYAEKGLVLARKDGNKLMESKFNAAFGRIYNTKTSYDTALVYWEKALDLAIKAKNKKQEASVYLGIGNLYGRQENAIRALEYFTKVLSIYEDIGSEKDCSMVLCNIASIHRAMDNTERAIYYLERAKNITEKFGDTDGKMQVYFELGAIYYVQNKSDQALEYALKAHEISRNIGNKVYQAAISEILLSVYAERDDDRAFDYANDCLSLSTEIGDPIMMAGAWNSLSNLYRIRKHYEECETAALKAWEIDSTNLNTGINILQNLTLANIAMGNKDKASKYLTNYAGIINKHIDKTSRELLTEMEVKYETEKKELRIAALEKEKQFYIWLSIAGAAVLLLAFGVLFYRHRLTEQKRKVAEQQRELAEQKVKQLEQEKQLIAAQAELEGEAAERSRLARDLHDGLGGLLSIVKLNLKDMKSYTVMDGTDVDRFGKALDVLDQSIGELRRVAHHLMPESLMRYGLHVSLEDYCRAIPGASFHYYGSDTRLDSRLEVLIYRCAYELVNNAVKHAGASVINVQLMVDDGLVSLTVHDNGRGFDPSTVTSGAGLENIRTRVSAYNGKIHIHTAPGKGTEVSIEIEKDE